MHIWAFFSIQALIVKFSVQAFYFCNNVIKFLPIKPQLCVFSTWKWIIMDAFCILLFFNIDIKICPYWKKCSYMHVS